MRLNGLELRFLCSLWSIIYRLKPMLYYWCNKIAVFAVVLPFYVGGLPHSTVTRDSELLLQTNARAALKSIAC